MKVALISVAEASREIRKVRALAERSTRERN